MGNIGDIPLEGDFDGDGIFNIAIFRPSIATFYYVSSQGGISISFGESTDIPTTAAYTRRRMQQLGLISI